MKQFFNNATWNYKTGLCVSLQTDGRTETYTNDIKNCLITETADVRFKHNAVKSCVSFAAAAGSMLCSCKFYDS